MRGLWSHHCPPSSPSSPPSHSPPFADTPALGSQRFHPEEAPPPPGGCERCLICPNCNVACRRLTSHTNDNPDRLFYMCNEHYPKFFKWADALNPSDFIDVPHCGGCKAGLCRVRKEKTGPNSGRILFLCTIKEGEGSCGYRVWQDEFELSRREDSERIASPPLRTANSRKSSLTNVDVVEESLQNDKAAGATSEMIEEITQNGNAASEKMEQLQFQEGKVHESSRRPPKRSRHGNPKGFTKRNSHVALGSLISSGSGTPSLDLAKNSLSIRHCWMTAAIDQNLSTELRGWWGRLAFQPMPNLIRNASFYISSAATKSCSNEVFVNFDGSAIVTSNSLELPTLSMPQVCNASLTVINPPQVALEVPRSSIDSSKTKFIIVMGNSISKAFVQAAMDLQNKFINLLETTNLQDHESMSREAEVTFAALDCLMFDHQELKEHTMEYIHQAMKLSEIKQSIPEIECHERLLEQCSEEKTRLDEIRRIHAETRQVLTSKQNHLTSLREHIASTKKWLVEVEQEFSFRESEMKDMVHVWERISQDKEILERKYHVAAKEVEDSKKLHQLKKEQHDAAEAAFNRARALLRGHIFTG